MDLTAIFKHRRYIVSKGLLSFNQLVVY